MAPPTHIICDQATSFLSSLTQAFFHHYGVRIITVSPTNNQSLLAEHGIKSLAEILKCHLTEFGSCWSEFLDFAMLAYNSYASPYLDGLSPFEHGNFQRILCQPVQKTEIFEGSPCIFS